MSAFIVTWTRDLIPHYIAAPAGYARRSSDGFCYREGSLSGAPEETTRREEAYQFQSYLAAKRQANKMGTSNAFVVDARKEAA